MSAESWAAVSALGVSALTAAGTVYTAKAGRRTRRQEKRDDFTTVTDRMDRELERLAARVAAQERESSQQKVQLAAQEHTINYMCRWTRSLVGYVQGAGLEPPPPPQPIPEDVRPLLHDIGI